MCCAGTCGAQFLDTELRREEFSHTVLHGIPTKLDANPRDRLEAAAAARAPASMQRESSDKARNPTSRPSTDPSRGSSVASSNRTPAKPAAAASVRPERSERESNWDKMVGGAGAPAAGKPSGAKAVDARAQAEEEERRKARKEEERAAERARQERMARGANLAAQRVSSRQGLWLLGGAGQWKGTSDDGWCLGCFFLLQGGVVWRGEEGVTRVVVCGGCRLGRR